MYFTKSLSLSICFNLNIQPLGSIFKILEIIMNKFMNKCVTAIICGIAIVMAGCGGASNGKPISGQQLAEYQETIAKVQKVEDLLCEINGVKYYRITKTVGVILLACLFVFVLKFGMIGVFAAVLVDEAARA